jgi:hypothetical protein
MSMTGRQLKSPGIRLDFCGGRPISLDGDFGVESPFRWRVFSDHQRISGDLIPRANH